MKKALLLFAMFAFLGTAYTASATVESKAGIYCDNCKGGHKCGENCKKDCKKAKSKKGCCIKKASASKKGCGSKRTSAAAKSCHGKSAVKASASATDSNKEEK